MSLGPLIVFGNVLRRRPHHSICNFRRAATALNDPSYFITFRNNVQNPDKAKIVDALKHTKDNSEATCNIAETEQKSNTVVEDNIAKGINANRNLKEFHPRKGHSVGSHQKVIKPRSKHSELHSSIQESSKMSNLAEEKDTFGATATKIEKESEEIMGILETNSIDVSIDNSWKKQKLQNHQVSPDEITSLPSDTHVKYSPFSSQLDDYIDVIGPPMVPSFNFAAYVNDSETLKQLVNLGVNLFSIERHKDKALAQKVLQLDFENDVKPLIHFLNDIHVPLNEFGTLITKNPHIIFEQLDDLCARVNYLKSKKFSNDSISEIIYKAPLWLSVSTKDIDRRLGVLQKMFSLTGNELRMTIQGYPKVATCPMDKIQVMSFSVKEEMGFTDQEMKMIFMKKPRIWTRGKDVIFRSFDYLHNEMKISHEKIVHFPEAMCTRRFRLEQRHLFLKSAGRAQYDPSKPLYVSLKALITGTDGEFAVAIANKPVHAYNEFLKTL